MRAHLTWHNFLTLQPLYFTWCINLFTYCSFLLFLFFLSFLVFLNPFATTTHHKLRVHLIHFLGDEQRIVREMKMCQNNVEKSKSNYFKKNLMQNFKSLKNLQGMEILGFWEKKLNNFYEGENFLFLNAKVYS